MYTPKSTLVALAAFAMSTPYITAATKLSTAGVVNKLPLRLWYDKPATYFEESMPIGNGRLGALVYGGATHNQVVFNDITMWTGKPVDPELGKGAATWIPEIRKALFNEDYAKADSLQLHVQGPNSQFYQPLAALHILDADSLTAMTAYHRELDIDSAICRDTYTRKGIVYKREYIASNPNGIIAMRVSASKAHAINYALNLSSLLPHAVKAFTDNNGKGTAGRITMTGHVMGNPAESIHFGAVLAVNTDDGQVMTSDSTLYIKGATDMTLYFANATSFRGADKMPGTDEKVLVETAVATIDKAVATDYADIRSKHVADYQRLFSPFQFSLGGASYDTVRTTEQQLKDYTRNNGDNQYLEMLYPQYGRYLLISSSRTSGVPANLQGLWAPALWSPWRGNYTMNINLEENYWPAEVTGLGEMVKPLEGFVSALAKNGSHTAKNFYGIQRGWCASHNSDLWAMTNPVGENRESPMWSNWNMGGAWLVNTLWEHYAFTAGDTEWLRSTAYPLMKGAAEFCLDWLIDNPKKPGELITAPCTSPEAQYVTDNGYTGCTLYGGTADMAIMRELFTNTLKAAKTLNADVALQAELTRALSRMRPYQIGKRGNLMEWYHDWDDQDWHHRHQSHLIGLYPGAHVTDAALQAACAKTLEIKGDYTTGWSTGWRINLWARLHNADKAYGILQRLLTYVDPAPNALHTGGTYPNLFDAHPPFQIDGNFGGTAGICEMLVQSHTDCIELLPALPKPWTEGAVKGIHARGGYVLNIEWKDSKLAKAEILSPKNGTVKLSYQGQTKTVKLKKGKYVTAY